MVNFPIVFMQERIRDGYFMDSSYGAAFMPFNPNYSVGSDKSRESLLSAAFLSADGIFQVMKALQN